MRYSPTPPRRLRRGMAIGLVLMIGLIVLVLGIAMLSSSGSLLRSTVDAKERVRSRYAAEAMVAIQMAEATEKASQVFGSDLNLPSISRTPLLTGGGEEAEAEMVSLSGTRATPLQDVIQSGDFKGLRGLRIPLLIKSTGYAPGGAKTQVNAEIRMYQIPIFQFGVFYEGNLEITPGPPMTVGGPVHTNGNAYFRAFNTGVTLSIQGPVTAVGSIYQWSRGGTLRYLFTPADTTRYFPVPGLTNTLTPATAGTLPDPVDGQANVTQNAPRLKLPIGSAAPVELIMPRQSTDPPDLARQKFDNKIVCTSSGCPSNRFVFGQGAQPSWITGPRAFYDRREQRWVKAWDFDVALMAANTTVSRDSIFYLADLTTENDNRSPAQPIIHAFRIINAAQLPRNLTIASANPVYVLGNFNVLPTVGCGDASSGTLPPGGDYCNAMIAANAVTVLSPLWSTLGTVNPGPQRYLDGTQEQNWQNPGWRTMTPTIPPAIPTPPTCSNCPNLPYTGLQFGVNAAILTGTKPTPTSVLPPDAAGTVNETMFENAYEGGWHNTIRFLENLSGVPFRFRGSFVCLWDATFPGLESSPTTRVMGRTAYYSPPDRDWAFDPRFSNLNNMPPGTPYLVTSQFSGWSEPR